MFIGRYYHSLEDKGRLAIPSVFRKQLTKNPIITRGLDNCLFILPKSTWEKLIKDLNISPLTNQDTRSFIRLISHEARSVNFDSQGRILIGKHLKSFAKLTKSVVVAGSLDWVEIWNQEKYHQHIEKLESSASIIAEKLSSQIKK